MKESYYLDTNIWLNLFKKEGDSRKGVPYWKVAKEFIQKVKENEGMIIVSTIVLKEIFFTTKDKFELIKNFFKESKFIQIVKTEPQDYELARKWEVEDKKLSFYDYLHVAISKRLDIYLITRDSDLIEFAKNIIKVSKPEDLIN